MLRILVVLGQRSMLYWIWKIPMVWVKHAHIFTVCNLYVATVKRNLQQNNRHHWYAMCIICDSVWLHPIQCELIAFFVFKLEITHWVCERGRKITIITMTRRRRRRNIAEEENRPQQSPKVATVVIILTSGRQRKVNGCCQLYTILDFKKNRCKLKKRSGISNCNVNDNNNNNK